MPTKNYIALYDIHYGKAKRYHQGRTLTVDTHNSKAIKTALQFSQFFKPQILVMGGDQLDCGEISHWNRGKKRLTEGFRLKESLDGFDENVLTPVEKILPTGARKIWIPGNHEKWMADFLDEHSALEGLLSIEEYLRLRHRGWELYEFGQIARIGKNYFIHGEGLTNANPARQALAKYKRNIRFGHRHTSSVDVDHQSYDRPHDRHVAKGVPCLANLNPPYGINGANNHINGLLAGTVADDGWFTDTVIEMVNNKFYWNGRLFDGTN